MASRAAVAKKVNKSSETENILKKKIKITQGIYDFISDNSNKEFTIQNIIDVFMSDQIDNTKKIEAKVSTKAKPKAKPSTLQGFKITKIDDYRETDKKYNQLSFKINASKNGKDYNTNEIIYIAELDENIHLYHINDVDAIELAYLDKVRDLASEVGDTAAIEFMCCGFYKGNLVKEIILDKIIVVYT